MRNGEAAERDSSRDDNSGAYYVFRIKKRDVYGVSIVAALWFAWSQGAEITDLFKNLFVALT